MNARPQSPDPPAEAPGLQGSLDRLEADLRKLQIEFERFFNGALLLPPEEYSLSLHSRIRKMRETKGLNSADRFRLGGLEARFNSYGELFSRRMRDREEGRSGGPSPSRGKPSAFDPQEGILVEERVDPKAAEALYVGLAQGGGAPRFDLHAFGQYLQRQADNIREKTHCKTVRFRLESSEGKVRLKARPIRDDTE